jgi:hypothetical protein
MTQKCRPTKDVEILPYPFNMGETWYNEVKNRYREHGGTGWSDDKVHVEL